MFDEADLFTVYRWLLATVCGVYAVVVSGRVLLNWLAWFSETREQAVIGRYTGVLLLRLRLRRFRWELCEIVMLAIVFGGVILAHYYVAS